MLVPKLVKNGFYFFLGFRAVLDFLSSPDFFAASALLGTCRGV
jgi:hypothetical protein